ncbi:hypothetical protein H9Q73_014361 [Fusarium xylarioides]|nr:hypothetical protein H9Q73_014361 [Fusarium xylarioides]
MSHTEEMDEDELIEEIIIDDDIDNDMTNLETVFSSMLGGIGVPHQARARALALAQDSEGAFIQRSCPPIARDYLTSLLRAGDQSFIELFRMPLALFLDLCRWLRDNTEAASNTQTHLELRVMIFCWIVAYGEKQRNAALKFGVSQSTVSRTMHQLLQPFRKLHSAFVQRLARLSEKVELDERYIHFSGVNAAIDGTHIRAFVPADQQRRWWLYHHKISQNVLVEVDLDDEIFTYVLAGAEGSMHDSAVMSFACTEDLELKNNRLVLANAGFGACQGLLTLYIGITYHLQEWREAGRSLTSLKEAYNLCYAEL